MVPCMHGFPIDIPTSMLCLALDNKLYIIHVTKVKHTLNILYAVKEIYELYIQHIGYQFLTNSLQ